MANNRLWLCYKPSGRVIFLGKRMGFGWYGGYEKQGNDINEFYKDCEEYSKENNVSQDDFCLLIEDNDGCKNINEDWKYLTDDNIKYVIFKEEIIEEMNDSML